MDRSDQSRKLGRVYPDITVELRGEERVPVATDTGEFEIIWFLDERVDMLTDKEESFIW